MTTTERALAILRDAQARAATLVERNADAYTDPWWGTWFRRADQRTIYESAIERAIEVLEGSDDDASWAHKSVCTGDVAGGC